MNILKNIEKGSFRENGRYINYIYPRAYDKPDKLKKKMSNIFLPQIWQGQYEQDGLVKITSRTQQTSVCEFTDGISFQQRQVLIKQTHVNLC